MGMLIAARISGKLGILSKDEQIRLKRIIERAGLPTEIPNLNVERIIQAMKHDKKILEGKMRFILPKSIGKVFVTEAVTPLLVEQVLGSWNEET